MKTPQELVAVSFPGQGAPYSELVRELTDDNKVGQEVADDSRRIVGEVSEVVGQDLVKQSHEASDEELADTRIAQSLLLGAGVAGAYYLIKKRETKVNFVRGHSAAAYTAATVAGALALKHAAEAIKQRGESMHQASEENPGSMAAVRGISPELLDPICERVGAFIANLNSPVQIIIGGSYEALEDARKLIKKAGGKATLFRNWKAGAAHTPHVQRVQEALQQFLKPEQISRPDTPVVKNTDGQITQDPDEIREDLTDAAAKVRWSDGTRTLHESGVTTHWEIGPGSKRVISGLLEEHKLGDSVRIKHISDLLK